MSLRSRRLLLSRLSSWSLRPVPAARRPLRRALAAVRALIGAGSPAVIWAGPRRPSAAGPGFSVSVIRWARQRRRRLGAVVALLAVLVVAAGLLVPSAALPRHHTLPIQAPGSQGSLRHYPWWDPRHWVDESGPGGRTLGNAAAGVPHPARPLHQAAAPPAHRVRELTAKRSEYLRSYQLSNGRIQAVISSGPVNYRDSRGRWQPISTSVTRTSRPGFSYANVTNTFRSYFGAASGQMVRFEAPGGAWLTMGVSGAGAGTGGAGGSGGAGGGCERGGCCPRSRRDGQPEREP